MNKSRKSNFPFKNKGGPGYRDNQNNNNNNGPSRQGKGGRNQFGRPPPVTVGHGMAIQRNMEKLYSKSLKEDN